jgi:hypothetical protein
MDKSTSDLNELLQHLQKDKSFSGSAEEGKLIDQFINKCRDNKFPKETVELVKLLQDIAQTNGSELQFKPLQLLRFCTKPSELRIHLREDFLIRINEMMPEVTNSPPVLIEILALHLRFIEINPNLVTH